MYKIEDLDFQFACMQAFNDWLANFCASAPNRLFGAAMILTQPLDRGVQEMKRCADNPHIDSTWPHSTKVLEDHFDGVPLEDQKRIARQNTIALYHLPLTP